MIHLFKILSNYEDEINVAEIEDIDYFLFPV